MHCFPRVPRIIALLVAPLLLGAGSDLSEQVVSEDPPQSAAVTSLTPTEVDAAIRGCRGPHAIFLSGGPCGEAAEAGVPGHQRSGMCAGAPEVLEPQAFSEFEGAAEMFAGVACFSSVRCDASPSFCAEHNIRRTPAVIVYPRSSGAAVMLTGKLEKQEIAAGVARPINDGDRALMLSANNIDIFLRDTLRPMKLMLFSSRKTTPVILQALSNDPDLWPHVRFGFVKHTEKTVLQQFQVTEVPHLVLQRGQDSSTRESYAGGEMTIDGLRDWIKERVQAHAVDPGEDGLFRAVEGASLLEEEETEDAEEDGEETSSPSAPPAGSQARKPGKPGFAQMARKPGKPGASRKPGQAATASSQKKVSTRYKALRRGAEGCPPGQEIATLEECYKACEELGLRAQPPWIATYPGLPRFCSVRERPSSESGTERMHFNSSPEGQGRADLSPLCKVQTSAGPPGSDASAANEPVPELNAASKDTLLAADGFCLVYLREGRIQQEEIAMLLDLEQQFRPQLDHQGTVMKWMWMDLHVERKFKAHFDPPALPSAVVLNPHKRPRFAMVKHSEDSEGDPLPTDQPAIALLLNTVLGGDAQFSPLPAKALSSWANL